VTVARLGSANRTKCLERTVTVTLARPQHAVDQSSPRTSSALPLIPLDGLRHTARAMLTGVGLPRRAPTVAVLRFVEGQRIQSRFGRSGLASVLAQAAALIAPELSDRERIAPDEDGDLVLLLRGSSDERVRARLDYLVKRLACLAVRLDGDHLRVTPMVGWVGVNARVGETDPDLLIDRATAAVETAASRHDLIPRRWKPGQHRPEREQPPSRLRTSVQGTLTLLIGIGVPFALLVLLDGLGIDLATPAYLAVVGSLVLTGVLIWMESLHALAHQQPPAQPAKPYPTASAVIPAYLPNEAATILDTLRSFLDQDYPAHLQIVLAYNTPHVLPVETELRELAEREPRLAVLKVPFSTSKAQNVNAALQVVDGEFVGVFDADHHPAAGSFARAWRWISHGVDIVQGHNVIRNGHASLVARTVAVEFESIYAVSHPGRARLHGFGLFGGSNGFWRTDVLHETRMHGEMMTEDIDSSVRALLSGRSLVNDRGLISRELAPATVKALWAQRMRWAQGWFQVCRRHLMDALRSPNLSRRNKFGVAFLFGWREIYPWLSLQMYPVAAFLVWRAGGVARLDWTIPIFLLTSAYTLSVGPSQMLFAWRLAAPEIRRHPGWFISYLFVSTVLYTEFKNHIARLSQIKELNGERRWLVTPRWTDQPTEAGPAATEGKPIAA
jgi:cellulose synthase/poly-beta-1,6-N-acetylglucosamine synthase-like glycosyltransferase